MTQALHSLGIDIGGTFTDVVLYRHEDHRVFAHKELTTPESPTTGALRGVRRLLEREGVRRADVARVVHATTLFTNALIERRGAPTGLITTRGFRDTLEMRREFKYDLYDLFLELPAPLVPRASRMEVDERTDADGTIRTEVDEAQLLFACDRLLAQGVRSLAVVFLNAYANSRNEERAREIITRAHPSLVVSVSCEVSPQMREYERTSTTVANAYIKPIAQQYLGELETELREMGVPGQLFMMLSNGGLTHVGEARRVPIQLLESGPAAGTIAAAAFSRRAGIANVLAFDMGGTTAKLSIVDDHEPLIAHQFEAARHKRFAAGSGLPINISTVELIEIGAGGGSLARVDALGLLKVGPESAGSRPGPACYARGGTQATVTDANLLIGLLDPVRFAGGTVPLESEAAEAAMRPLAAALGEAPEAVTLGVRAIVNESMAAAARVHIAERGRSAADYALLVTGGGGPLHGCDVARRLGIPRVVCPPHAGVASALGLLIAPARVDRSATLACGLDEVDEAVLESRFAALEEAAAGVIRQTIAAKTAHRFTRAADLRFTGQGFELVTVLPPGPYGEGSKRRIRAAFEHDYLAVFGHLPPQPTIELVNIRVSAVELTEERPLDVSTSPGSTQARVRHARTVLQSEDGRVEVPVLDRFDIPVGCPQTGPLLVEEASSTLVVPAGAHVLRDAADNLVIDLAPASE